MASLGALHRLLERHPAACTLGPGRNRFKRYGLLVGAPLFCGPENTANPRSLKAITGPVTCQWEPVRCLRALLQAIFTPGDAENIVLGKHYQADSRCLMKLAVHEACNNQKRIIVCPQAEAGRLTITRHLVSRFAGDVLATKHCYPSAAGLRKLHRVVSNRHGECSPLCNGGHDKRSLAPFHRWCLDGRWRVKCWWHIANEIQAALPSGIRTHCLEKRLHKESRSRALFLAGWRAC
jgi:hypothetical protein